MRKILLVLATLYALPVTASHSETQTLEQALVLSYQHNPGLMSERAKLRATDEQVSTALSGYRPSIDAVGEGGRTTSQVSGDTYYSGNSNINPHSVSMQVTQPVFRGFKTTAGVESAEAAVKAQRAALQDAEQKLIYDAAKAYLDVLQATEVLQLNRENEQVLQKQHDATLDRFHVGELKKTDVSQAESRLKSAMVSRLQAEGDLSNQRTTFARITGDMPGTLENPHITLDKPQTLSEAVTLSLLKNPSIVAASYTYDSSKADITVAQGNLLPQVDIVGSATRGWEQSTTIPQRQDSATILARVTVPLYRSGADYSKTRAAQQTSTQRRLELENARQKARELAMTSWQSLVTARASIAGRNEVVDATARALEGVRIESQAGTRTTLDVLNAEQELLEAKINLVKATHDEALAMLQLKSAVGDLTAEALHLPVDLYDPTKNYNDVREAWFGFVDPDEK